MRPRIAIPADTLTEATNVINERMAPYAPKPVIEAIVKSGGVPVIFRVFLQNWYQIISTFLTEFFLQGELMLIQHFWRGTSSKVRGNLS